MSGQEMADTLTFRAVFVREPDGKAWTATSPDVNGAITWGRSLRRAEENLREAVALVLDLPEGSEDEIQFEFDFDLSDELLNAVFRQALQTRRSLARAQEEANEAAALAVYVGRETGLSVRDLAELIELSYQRVQQIASELSQRPVSETYLELAQSAQSETDAPSDLTSRLFFKVAEELGPLLYERESMSDAELRLRVLEMFEQAMDQEEELPHTGADRRVLLNKLASDIFQHARGQGGPSATGAESDVTSRLFFKVAEELGPLLYERESMSDAELRLRVLEMFEWAVDQEEELPHTGADRRVLINELAMEMLDHAGVHRHILSGWSSKKMRMP